MKIEKNSNNKRRLNRILNAFCFLECYSTPQILQNSIKELFSIYDRLRPVFRKGFCCPEPKMTRRNDPTKIH